MRIGSARLTKTSNGVRTAAMADGRETWFESADAALAPSPEAFASAMLIPAMHAELPLVVDENVCAAWANNVRPIIDAAARWWNYPVHQPQFSPIVRSSAPRNTTALCFSGGVDSFHTLLRGPRPVDMLVYAIGYDVRIDDVRRIAAVRDSLRRVAAELRIRAVFISSNIRRHPVFRAAPWERTHGGALAALGHLLGNEVGRLEISSSCARENDIPWGSRWDIDPFFSSTAVEIEHIGAEMWRADKLRAIASEELVRRHLRVCWENRNADMNCCQCEKCLRTMLVLAACGQLEHYRQFHGGRGLAGKLDRLPHIPCVMRPVYQSLLSRGLTGELAAAVRRLLARSPEQEPPAPSRVGNYVRRARTFIREVL